MAWRPSSSSDHMHRMTHSSCSWSLRMTYTERSWRTCVLDVLLLMTVTRWDSTASARGRMISVQMLCMTMTESSSALML